MEWESWSWKAMKGVEASEPAVRVNEEKLRRSDAITERVDAPTQMERMKRKPGPGPARCPVAANKNCKYGRARNLKGNKKNKHYNAARRPIKNKRPGK